MRRSLKNVIGKKAINNSLPPAKRAHVYEKHEIGNASFVNDVNRCDIIFCIPTGEPNDAEETQDIDVKTNGKLVKQHVYCVTESKKKIEPSTQCCCCLQWFSTKS